jgi:hypothetical protein
MVIEKRYTEENSCSYLGRSKRPAANRHSDKLHNSTFTNYSKDNQLKEVGMGDVCIRYRKNKYAYKNIVKNFERQNQVEKVGTVPISKNRQKRLR